MHIYALYNNDSVFDTRLRYVLVDERGALFVDGRWCLKSWMMNPTSYESRPVCTLTYASINKNNFTSRSKHVMRIRSVPKIKDVRIVLRKTGRIRSYAVAFTFAFKARA